MAKRALNGLDDDPAAWTTLGPDDGYGKMGLPFVRAVGAAECPKHQLGREGGNDRMRGSNVSAYAGLNQLPKCH